MRLIEPSFDILDILANLARKIHESGNGTSRRTKIVLNTDEVHAIRNMLEIGSTANGK
jgi:hypothetical protein